MIIRTFLVLFILLPVLFVSCEKEPKKIGLSLQPPEDKLKVVFSDTSTLISYSVFEDSVRTDELATNLMGSMYDPVFGKTVASIATQVLMSKAGIDFGDNPNVDSLILSMVYVGYYGDINTLQKVRIYEISEDIFQDSIYYSTKRVNHLDIDYAHHNFYPRPNDSILIDGTTQAPQLRINLSAITPILAEKILNAPADVLADNDMFLEYFKGLFITCDPVNYGGSIPYFNMTTANSSLILYYSNDSVDGQSYEMYINDNCARFTQYEHFNYDYADQQFRKQLIYNDTIMGNNTLYLQAMGGVKTLIKFPNLNNYLSSSKVAINEATLYLYNNDPQSEYDAPLILFLARLDEDGDYALLTDYLEGSEYYGGSYDENSSSYKFRISRFIQETLNGNYNDPVLNLSISGSSSIANRLVLNGPGHSFSNLKLEIIYTEVN